MKKKMNWLFLSILIIAIYMVIYQSLPDFNITDTFVNYIYRYCIMASFLIIVLWFLNMFHVLHFNFKQFGHGLLVGLPLIVGAIISGAARTISGLSQGYSFVSVFHIILFAVAIILGTGFCEEVLCRGIIMNLISDHFGKITKKDIWKAVILSSLIFALAHYSNMLLPNANIINCTGQVCFTFSFGMILGSVYARCRNIWAPIILHGFWDFCNMVTKGFFGVGELLDLSSKTEINLFYIIGIFTFAAVMVGIGFAITAFILRKKKIQECLES